MRLLRQGADRAEHHLHYWAASIEVIPEIAALATSSKVRGIVELILEKSFLPVRGILFDKVPYANWKVPWITCQEGLVFQTACVIFSSNMGP